MQILSELGSVATRTSNFVNFEFRNYLVNLVYKILTKFKNEKIVFFTTYKDQNFKTKNSTLKIDKLSNKFNSNQNNYIKNINKFIKSEIKEIKEIKDEIERKENFSIETISYKKNTLVQIKAKEAIRDYKSLIIKDTTQIVFHLYDIIVDKDMTFLVNRNPFVKGVKIYRDNYYSRLVINTTPEYINNDNFKAIPSENGLDIYVGDKLPDLNLSHSFLDIPETKAESPEELKERVKNRFYNAGYELDLDKVNITLNGDLVGFSILIEGDFDTFSFKNGFSDINFSNDARVKKMLKKGILTEKNTPKPKETPAIKNLKKLFQKQSLILDTTKANITQNSEEIRIEEKNGDLAWTFPIFSLTLDENALSHTAKEKSALRQNKSKMEDMKNKGILISLYKKNIKENITSSKMQELLESFFGDKFFIEKVNQVKFIKDATAKDNSGYYFINYSFKIKTDPQGNIKINDTLIKEMKKRKFLKEKNLQEQKNKKLSINKLIDHKPFSIESIEAGIPVQKDDIRNHPIEQFKKICQKNDLDYVISTYINEDIISDDKIIIYIFYYEKNNGESIKKITSEISTSEFNIKNIQKSFQQLSTNLSKKIKGKIGCIKKSYFAVTEELKKSSNIKDQEINQLFLDSLDIRSN